MAVPLGGISRQILSSWWHHGRALITRVAAVLLLLVLLLSPCVYGFSVGRRLSMMSASTSRTSSSTVSFDALANKHVLVVGGSGRVGGSVVTQLIKRHCAHVTVGGTNINSFTKSKARWQTTLFPSLPLDEDKVSFCTLNREDTTSISTILLQQPYDLVVHTAGPFQGKVNAHNGVLEACIQNHVPYVDVCDDYCTAKTAKAKYDTQAREQNVPCLVSTGCWPGVSSLMAKQLISKALELYPTKLKPQDLRVDFSFFTAGSGGAGSTLLVATFLILAEKALTIQNGRRTPVQAMKKYSTVNFGDIVGDKEVAHLNLLETASIHDVLGVGTIETLFGTAPAFWNTLLGVMAQLPPSLLSNEAIMTKLALFSLPIVRLVDYFAGATNAMRCDVMTCCTDNDKEQPNLHLTALYAHDNLEPCVGECVVAFCAAVLSNGVVPAGVSFPEEGIDAGEDAAAVLNLASVGTHTIEAYGTPSMDDLKCQDVWGDAGTKQTPNT